MPEPIYFPIARAKAGEIDAIGRLAPHTHSFVRPMLDFALQKKKDKRPLAHYLCEKLHEIAISWGTADPIYLDFSRYEPTTGLLDGRHIVDYVFDISRQSGLKAIPVVAPLSMRGPGTDYFQAVSRVISRDMRGVAVRIPYEYFSDSIAIEDALRETLRLTVLSPQNVDVYLDAFSLDLIHANFREEIALAQTLRMAATVVKKLGYRRVIFAASSIPGPMVRHKKGEILKVPRTDFRVWRRVVVEPEFEFLQFGDYGIIYPGQVESDARVIPPSRVRTSSEEEYVFYKGGREAIRTLSQTIVADGLLSGPSDSWGANAVRECAAGYGDSGGPSQWIARDTNMHIESTVTAIARYVPPDQLPSMPSNSKRGSPWLQESIGFAE